MRAAISTKPRVSNRDISERSSGKYHYPADERSENNNGAFARLTYAHKSIIKIRRSHEGGGEGTPGAPTSLSRVPACIWSLRESKSRIKIAPSICHHHRASNRSYYRASTLVADRMFTSLPSFIPLARLAMLMPVKPDTRDHQ